MRAGATGHSTYRGTPLASGLMACAMVLFAITLRHASTGPDRFVLAVVVIAALVQAGVAWRRWSAIRALRPSMDPVNR